MNTIQRDEQELVDAAIKAYFRRYGESANQPSRYSSAVDDGHVILRNINGELARYKVDARGGLHYVDDETSARKGKVGA